MASIFISYRREDSAAYAGRLRDHLRQHFGKAEVFMDIDTIDPGQPFDVAIQEAVGACDILIAVIGPQWSAVKDANGRRRLENDDDFIRLEVATALERNIPVIPMLVGGATMPSAEELPDNLKSLARRNALSVTNERWDYDIGRLLKAMDRVIDDGHTLPILRSAKLWTTMGAAALVAAGAFWIYQQGGFTTGRTQDSGLVPERAEFGPVTKGQTSEPREFVLTNPTDTAIIVLGLTLAGDDDFLIEDDACSAVAVKPGSSCKILTRFRPTSAGDKTALLLVKGDNNETLGFAGLEGSGVVPKPDPVADVTVVVPETRGVSEAAARRKLEGMCRPEPCLEVAAMRTPSDTVADGEVLGTRPGASATVKRGDRVILVVSSGTEVVSDRNDFRNFRGIVRSDQEVSFTADYTYIGDFESQTPPIRLTVRQADDSVVPGMVYRYDIARTGTGSTKLNAYADFGDGGHTSKTVSLCFMDVSRQTRGYCKSFPFENRWSGKHGSTRGRPNSIYNFRAEDPSRSELKVTVNYIYDGSNGTGMTQVNMTAVARRSDGRQVPRTHFEGLGGPGEVRVGVGNSTMLIRKSSTQRESSVDVRVCIYARNPAGPVVCEVFPHRKVWN